MTSYKEGMNMNRLRELRKSKKLTLKETVEKLKVQNSLPITADTLAKYERGDREPKIETWQKLANFFNVSVPYIRGEIDTELIAKIAKMAFCLLEPSLNVELGEKPLPEKGKKGCIGLLLIALINQLGLNTEDIIKELSLKMEGSDFASMINNDDVEGLTKAGLKLANIYDEI